MLGVSVGTLSNKSGSWKKTYRHDADSPTEHWGLSKGFAMLKISRVKNFEKFKRKLHRVIPCIVWRGKNTVNLYAWCLAGFNPYKSRKWPIEPAGLEWEGCESGPGLIPFSTGQRCIQHIINHWCLSENRLPPSIHLLTWFSHIFPIKPFGGIPHSQTHPYV